MPAVRPSRIQLVAAAGVALLIAGCGSHGEVVVEHAAPAHSQYHVAMAAEVHGSEFLICCAGDHVHLSLTLGNDGPYHDWYESHDGKTHRFWITDGFGHVVWDSSLHEFVSGHSESWELPVGHELSFESTWHVEDDFGVPVAPGIYTVHADWCGELLHDGPPPPPPHITLEVVSATSI